MRNLIAVILGFVLAFLFFTLFCKNANATTITVTYTITSNFSKSVPKPALTSKKVTKAKMTKLSDGLSKVEGDIQQKVYEATCKAFGCDQWEAMKYIVSHESGFEPCKINGGAVDCNYNGDRAAGLGQALPMQKMGCSTLADIDCQIQWLMSYIKNRYGDAVNAQAFWISNSWY